MALIKYEINDMNQTGVVLFATLTKYEINEIDNTRVFATLTCGAAEAGPGRAGRRKATSALKSRPFATDTIRCCE